MREIDCVLKINKKDLNKILTKDKILKLTDYFYIQNNIHNVSSIEFRKRFNKFYYVNPHRNLDWQKVYYSLLKNSVGKKDISYEKIISTLYKKTGRVEASFASKLVATLNMDMPVIDSVVLKYFKKQGCKKIIMPPYSNTPKERTEKLSILHKNLIEIYNNFLKTKKGKEVIKIFRKNFKEIFPTEEISDIKIIDFILWQTRD